MKILIVSHSYIAEENCKNLDGLAPQCDVQAVVPSWVHDRVLGKLKPKRQDVVKPYPRIQLPRVQYLLGSFDLGMRCFQPDVVHIEYDPWAPVFWQTYFAKRIFAKNAALVCTVKKNTFRQLPQPLQWMKDSIAQFFIKRIDYFLAVNEGVERIYKTRFGVEDNKMSIVQHLGLDTVHFQPAIVNKSKAKGDAVILGYCGRFDAHKGVAEFIEAGRGLKEKGHNIVLRLLGDGTLRDELIAGGETWIEYIDPVPHDQVSTFMQALDVFVLPARITADHEEHDGHALMEAMACGVACVGTQSGVIPELLSDGAGLVVSPQDAIALAQTIEPLITDSTLRQNLGSKACEKAELLYSINAIAAQKIKIYEKVLS